MNYFIKLSSYVFAFSLFFVGTVAFAQDIGNVAPGESTQEVVANLFNIVIAAGVLLSVVFLAIGGFEYMGSDVVTQKENARKRIIGALFGLLILLGSYLVLNIINPDILKNDPLRNLGGGSGSSSSRPGIISGDQPSSPPERTGDRWEANYEGIINGRVNRGIIGAASQEECQNQVADFLSSPGASDLYTVTQSCTPSGN